MWKWCHVWASEPLCFIFFLPFDKILLKVQKVIEDIITTRSNKTQDQTTTQKNQQTQKVTDNTKSTKNQNATCPSTCWNTTRRKNAWRWLRSLHLRWSESPPEPAADSPPTSSHRLHSSWKSSLKPTNHKTPRKPPGYSHEHRTPLPIIASEVEEFRFNVTRQSCRELPSIHWTEISSTHGHPTPDQTYLQREHFQGDKAGDHRRRGNDAVPESIADHPSSGRCDAGHENADDDRTKHASSSRSRGKR